MAKKETKKNVKKTSREIREEGFENSFIREVNEDVQQDNLQQFLKKYGAKVAAICTAIIMVVVIKTVYNNIHEKSVMREAGVFQTVVSNVDTLLAEKKVLEAKDIIREFLDEAKYDYKDIAYTMLFELSINSNIDELMELLGEMKEEANTDKVRDFATFNYSILAYERDVNLEGLIENLSPLMKDRRSNFRNNSYILIISAALNSGNNDVANKFIADLERDKKLPIDIKTQLDGLKKLVEAKS
ncbi:MAG: hypothetical protein N4A44_04900 [Alphaproteobacteria bacterium]|jgi:hypothetical protein|nr:hypothetical protein [Alphaproteobacteria bacterium]